MILRDYQDDVVARLKAAVMRHRCVILQAETGSGKSVMALDLILRANEKAKNCLFLARGRHLVDQFSSYLNEEFVPYGVIMRGRGYTPARIQVCSKDTLLSWCIVRKVRPLPPADLVVVDECHQSGPSWMELLRAYPSAVIIGLSATPAWANGRGMGGFYGEMVKAIPGPELIRRGYLVPCKVFAPSKPDLRAVKVKDGDYVVKDLSGAMDKPKLVGDAVTQWQSHAEGRQTIVFCCDRAHAHHVVYQYRQNGIAAAYLDGTMDDAERKVIVDEFNDKKIQVIVNIAVFKEGVDLPIASCIQLLRPTKSLVLFRQMVGRGKRPFPGKVDCLLLDHAGAVHLHGMPDEDVDWTLDPGKKIEEIQKDKRDRGELPMPTECPKCHAMYVRLPACPACGYAAPKNSRSVNTKNGMLQPVTTVKQITKAEEQQRYWIKCLAVAAHKGRSFRAARAMFHQKYSSWPDGFSPSPTQEQLSLPVRDVYPKFVRGKREEPAHGMAGVDGAGHGAGQQRAVREGPLFDQDF